MALLSRDSPIQQRPATVLGGPPMLFFQFPEDIGKRGWCVSAELSLAQPGAENVYDDPCAGYWGQGRKLANRQSFEKFR